MDKNKSLFRFEFDVIPLSMLSIYAFSIESAIEEIKLTFGESIWKLLSQNLFKITKLS